MAGAYLLAVFVYATHATQAIAFEWKPVSDRSTLVLLKVKTRRGNVGTNFNVALRINEKILWFQITIDNVKRV